MKIAVEGCCHGELDQIYETLEFIQQKDNIKIDLLLICGDFQTVRNRSDLQAMAVPQKYQKMNTFWKYYKGEKTAPILTVFIGGNHEASNFLQELPYGGWVAPNIYYLGYAGVVQIGGVRLGGLSGIYKSRDYNKGHYEHPPYDEGSKRSAYHIRNLEVFRLKQISQPMDIFLTHDWPTGIHKYGNVNWLLKKKPFFREEIKTGSLGSPPAEQLLHHLKPSYWFSAHLHVKFAALVEHEVKDGPPKTTRFLSLDKCLPGREFLQVLDVPHDSSKSLQLELDPEWLAILKSTNHLLHLHKSSTFMPGVGGDGKWDYRVTEQQLEVLNADFDGFFKVPENFERTARVHIPTKKTTEHAPRPQIVVNPQTALLCEMLDLTDPFAVFVGQQTHGGCAQAGASPATDSASNVEDDDVTGDDSDFIDSTMDVSALSSSVATTVTQDELSVSDDHEANDQEKDESVAEGKDEGVAEVKDEGVAEVTEPPILSPIPSVEQRHTAADGYMTPPNNGQTDIPDLDRSAVLDVSPGTKRLCEDMENSLHTSSPNPHSDVKSDIKPKKFKRRNLSIYGSIDS